MGFVFPTAQVVSLALILHWSVTQESVLNINVRKELFPEGFPQVLKHECNSWSEDGRSLQQRRTW